MDKGIVIILSLGLLGFVYVQTLSPDVEVPIGNPLRIKHAGIKQERLDGIFIPNDHVVKGLPTVIEFYTDSCPACRELHKAYQKFLQARPDVAIRKIRLDEEWDPDVLLEENLLNIMGTPHVMVYGPDGYLIAEDMGGSNEGMDFLWAWIQNELIVASR